MCAVSSAKCLKLNQRKIKIVFSLFLLCFCVGLIFSFKGWILGRDEEDARDSYARLLQRAVEREPWNPEEQPCARTLLTVLQHAHNFTLHAVWMLDAMQLPNGQLFGSEAHLGNYDECLEPRWRHSHPQLSSQYCLAEVQLVPSQRRPGYVPDPELSAEAYLKARTEHDFDLAKMYWGICLPAECPESAVSKLYRVLLRTSHLGPLAEQANIDVNYCQAAGDDDKTDHGVHVFGIIIISLLVLAIGSTYYVAHNALNPQSYVHELVRSFDLQRNLDSLTSVRDNEIYSMNLMRFVSCVMVVVAHHCDYIMTILVVDGVHVDKFIEESGAILSHGTVVVDTFFAIAGILVVRGCIGGKMLNPLKYLLKRYMRFASVLALLLYLKTFGSYELGSGPLWRRWMREERDICQNHAWATLAMVQTYFDSETLCLMASWSLSVDYNLSILAVVLCVIYRKNKRLGFFTFFAVLFVALPIPGYVQNFYNTPVAFTYGLESMRDFRANVVYKQTYSIPYLRPSSFMVGMMMGWILVNYKPAQYRKRISMVTSYVFLILCLAVMLFIIQLGGDYYYRHPAAAGSAAFTSLNRAVFAAAVCGVIATAEYGDLGFVNRVFKWSPLVPLARLTYGVYLVHSLIMERNVYNTRSNYTFDVFTIICDGAGVVTISFVFSFILYMLMEAPSSNVVNTLLDGPKKPAILNNHSNIVAKKKVTKSKHNKNSHTVP